MDIIPDLQIHLFSLSLCFLLLLVLIFISHSTLVLSSLSRSQYLEEQLEDGRHRVLDSESGAKKAEEELAVAKERLLLQENELQKKSGTSLPLSL